MIRPVRDAVESDLSCLLCRTWEKTTPAIAFAKGEQIDATHAHSAMVLGFIVGCRTVVAQLCETHQRQFGELTAATEEAEKKGAS